MVLQAEGSHFTAGLDLDDFSNTLIPDNLDPPRGAEQLRRLVLHLQETFSTIDRWRTPVLAAIQGGCIGGGVDLATACDLRYCTSDSFFSIQEINIGITADVGTLQRLPHLLPQGICRELSYTGRRMFAEEALHYGLVNKVFNSVSDLRNGVMDVANEITSKNPLATVGIKEMLNYARDHSIADGLNYVATWNAGMLSENDLKEAFLARREKRTPNFDDLLPARRLQT